MNPYITLIAAVDEDYGIGKDGTLPWPKSSLDMRLFRMQTSGHPIVMGRKTYESLPEGPLNNRHNIVLTRQKHYKTRDKQTYRYVDVVHSVPETLNLLEDTGQPAFVIGGALAYGMFMEHASKVILTRIPGTYDADVIFPSYVLQRDFHQLTQVDFGGIDNDEMNQIHVEVYYRND